MENLYTETINFMARKGKTIEDIDWIGGRNFTVDIDNFFEVAKETNYDPGYGLIEVATDLTIAFKDGSYMRRNDYDGSEWWDYYRCIKPVKQKHIECLCAQDAGDYYRYAETTLEEMNGYY